MIDFNQGFQRNTSAEHFKKLILMLDRQESREKDRLRSQSSSLPTSGDNSNVHTQSPQLSSHFGHQHDEDLPPLPRSSGGIGMSMNMNSAQQRVSLFSMNTSNASDRFSQSSPHLDPNSNSPNPAHRRPSNRRGSMRRGSMRRGSSPPKNPERESVTKVHPLIQKSFTSMFQTTRSELKENPLSGIKQTNPLPSAGGLFYQSMEKHMASKSQESQRSSIATCRDNDRRTIRNPASRKPSKKYLLEKSKALKSTKQANALDRTNIKDSESWTTQSGRNFTSPIAEYRAKYKYNLELKKPKKAERTGSREGRRKRNVKFEGNNKIDRHQQNSSRYSYMSGRSAEGSSSPFHQSKSSPPRESYISEIEGLEHNSEHSSLRHNDF